MKLDVWRNRMFDLSSSKINKRCEEKYYDLIIDKRSKKGIKWLETLCQLNFGKTFKQIVLMEPEKIPKFVTDFDTNEDKELIIDAFKSIILRADQKTNYIVDTLYKDMCFEARKQIYEIANAKTCPYCNRNYIDVIDGDEYHSTFELDHFYSKDKYPMLAVSLYNLIPVCPSCNRIKGNKVFQYYPYDSKRDMSNGMRFSCKCPEILLNEEEIELDIEYDNKDLEEESQKLYLKELYSNHKDIAAEIVQKSRYQGTGYMDGLYKQLGSLFSSKEEVYRMVYGNYLNKEDWSKRPLSKFTYDIAKEVLEIYGIDIDK